MAFSDSKKINLGNKFDPINLFLETYDYVNWFENEESADTTKIGEKFTHLPPSPALEGDGEEVKEEKVWKLLTPSKLLTRLSIFLAQTKSGNNSNKLKMKLDK